MGGRCPALDKSSFRALEWTSMGVSSDSTLGEKRVRSRRCSSSIPHFVRRPVPGVCSGRGVVQGITNHKLSAPLPPTGI